MIVLAPLIAYALYLVYHEAAALIRHERHTQRYLDELTARTSQDR